MINKSNEISIYLLYKKRICRNGILTMKIIDIDELKKKLPECPGIIGKEEYFNSAVLIPLININEELHFLFEKRSAKIRQGGEICFPGGEFDRGKDKSYLEASIRETMEELGISRDKIKILGNLDTFIGPMGVTVDTFVALLEINNIDEIKTDKNEVEKIFTIPVSFFIDNPPDEYEMRLEMHPYYVNGEGKKVELFPAEQLGLPEKYSKPRRGKNHKVYVYKTKPDTVWGITAKLILEFVKLTL